MPAPANDNFADAEVISGETGTSGPYDITDATIEVDEPFGSSPGNDPENQSIWFKWIAPGNGEITIDLLGSVTDTLDPLDTTLAVWTGTSLGDLVEVTSNDDGDVDVTSAVTFAAAAGTTYWIQAGTYSDSSIGTITLNWSLVLDEVVTFTYTGDGTVVATITHAVIDGEYAMSSNLTGASDDTQTAVTSTLVLTITGGSMSPGDVFDVWVFGPDGYPQYLAATLFVFGTSGEMPFPCVWSFDGVDTLSVTFIAEDGVDYEIDAIVPTIFSGTPITGTGVEVTLNQTLPSAPSQDYFPAYLRRDPDGGFVQSLRSVRLFKAGLAGAGFRGNPTEVSGSTVSLRTFEGRAWKWIVRDLKTSVVLTSLTTFATDITTARLLAAPWPASCTVPADDPRVNTIYEQFEDPTWDEPFVAEGIRVLTGFRDTGVNPLWEPEYTGIIDQVYDFVEDGVPYIKISASDARKYLDYIPLVDEAGELPGPDGIVYSSVNANAIARAALENWITNNPGCLASIIFDLSSGVDEDCVPVTITFGRGTMVGEVWSQLEQMGVIDIVLDPVHDPADRPGVMSVVNFEPEHGAARPAAIFSWDLSPRSLPEIGRLEDGTKRANTIQGFTDAIEPVTAQVSPDSIEKYGEYWDQRAWPGVTNTEAIEAFGLEDLVFRKNRQTTLSATPAAARAAQPVQDYDIGDRAPFYASRALRKPIAGQARIYGIPFVIGDDARESVQELIVSADAVA